MHRLHLHGLFGTAANGIAYVERASINVSAKSYLHNFIQNIIFTLKYVQVFARYLAKTDRARFIACRISSEVANI